MVNVIHNCDLSSLEYARECCCVAGVRLLATITAAAVRRDPFRNHRPFEVSVFLLCDFHAHTRKDAM